MPRHITKILAVTLLCHTAMARPVLGWLRTDLENMKPEEKVVYLERQTPRGSSSTEVGKIMKSVFEGPVEYPTKIILTVKTRPYGGEDDEGVTFNDFKWLEESELTEYELTLRLEWTLDGEPMFSQASTRPRDQMDFSWHSWAYKKGASSGYCKLFSLRCFSDDEESTKKLQNLTRQLFEEELASKQMFLASEYLGSVEASKIKGEADREWDARKIVTEEYEIPVEFKEFLHNTVPGLQLETCGEEFFTNDLRKQIFAYSKLCKAIKVIEASEELKAKHAALQKQRIKKRQEDRLRRRHERQRREKLQKALEEEAAARKADKLKSVRKSLQERQEFEAYVKRNRIPVRGMRRLSVRPVTPGNE